MPASAFVIHSRKPPVCERRRKHLISSFAVHLFAKGGENGLGRDGLALDAQDDDARDERAFEVV